MESIAVALAMVCAVLFNVVMILLFGGVIIYALWGIVYLIKSGVEEIKLKKEYKRGYDEGYSVAFDLIDDWDKAKRSYIKWED